ncbi:capsule assembly Wzi family protein [Chromatiaceae bacterium AAb-1]|nr:capsule assembly Wzi family protein [Chromatiaceae bacterium AAb-1]
MKRVVWAALLLSAPVSAKWWIEPSEMSVRADLQLLSDYRLIQQPVNTYPLMWTAIADELHALKPEQLTARQNAALQRLLQAWQKDQGTQLSYNASLGTTKNRFVGFGEQYRDKASVQLNYGFSNERFSGRAAASYHANSGEGNNLRLDHSYLAALLGNWVISAGAFERYWGPSWDTSLQLSHNARPVPGISLTRHSSAAFDNAILGLIGPWTFTTSFNQLESDRAIPDAKLWMARATARPLSGLELGVSWTMTWGGDGYGNGLSDWWNGLSDGGTVDGAENMLAGYDLRWSGVAGGVPYGLYAQVTAEDFHWGKKRLISTAFMVGADVYIQSLNSRLYLEYSDTKVGCTEGNSKLYNCFYEHSYHREGYRYYDRSMGGTYDNDALTMVAGIITPLSSGLSWHNKFRWLRLNIDGIDRGAPGGNKVSPGRYEQQLQWQSIYQYQLNHGTLSITTALTYQHWPELDKDNRLEPSLALSWEGRFW